jgi:ABC-type glycerol-3-phosphate transport system permease component
MLLRLMRHLLVYGLLLAGAAAYSFPFLWMASTSVKVDRELYTGDIRLIPITPVPRAQSPYIDDRYYERPGDARAEWLLPKLKELAGSSGFRVPQEVSREAAEEQVARGLYQRLAQRIPKALWDGDDRQALLAAAAGEVTAEVVKEIFENVYRAFTLGRILVRSQELQEEELEKDKPFAERLDNLTPQTATLVEREIKEKAQRFAVVRYDFSAGDCVRLSRTFELPFEAERLQRIRVSLQPDDTWHELWLTVEKNGKIHRAVRPLTLANFRALTATWQEPGPDDYSTKIRNWTVFREESGASSPVAGPRQLKLTLELRRTSRPGAWAHKLGYNYSRVLDYIPLWRYVSVSLFLVLLNVALALFSSSLVAYAFARLQWPGRDFCFVLMLATMMIPPQVTMIPHFLIWKNVGAYDTLTPLWLGHAFGSAFFIFLMRQTLKGIPRDLEDAARIDGCGFFRIYWFVMLPLVKPSLAAIAIFTFMGAWNDFMGPLIYLADQRLYPLAFGLYAFAVQVGNDPVLTMAASLVMTLPVIVIFFFAQKYFIQGITMTGMKG